MAQWVRHLTSNEGIQVRVRPESELLTYQTMTPLEVIDFFSSSICEIHTISLHSGTQRQNRWTKLFNLSFFSVKKRLLHGRLSNKLPRVYNYLSPSPFFNVESSNVRHYLEWKKWYTTLKMGEGGVGVRDYELLKEKAKKTSCWKLHIFFGYKT